MNRELVFWVLWGAILAATFVSGAQAQFTVGGVTGGAQTAGVNCFGDADGRILAYSSAGPQLIVVCTARFATPTSSPAHQPANYAQMANSVAQGLMSPSPRRQQHNPLGRWQRMSHRS